MTEVSCGLMADAGRGVDVATTTPRNYQVVGLHTLIGIPKAVINISLYHNVYRD